ncbi:hypothetical protein C8A03DRAFT_12714, partial [Achaetomium macrosporum]
VLLSLSADQSSGARYPERRITLTPEKHQITIGRASKKTDSGFVAAVDNAWFDCAVMSRLHAQISANMDQEKLEIHDVGSLHGTFINGDGPVPAKKTRELKDGDTLRFGAPIWRGNEQYVPTTVKVGIQFINRDASGTGTFQVPDGSDDEDSSDFDQSTDSDEGGKSTEPSPAAQNTRIPQLNVIDLTSNHGCAESRQVIDLSSDCGSPISIEDDEDEEHDSISLAKPDRSHLDDVDVDHPTSPDAEDGLGDLGDADRVQDTQMDDYDEDESESDEDFYGGVADEIDGGTDDNVSEEYTSDDDSFDRGSWDDVPPNPPDYTGSVEHPETLALIESLSHPVPQPRSIGPVSIMGLLNSDEPEPPALPSRPSCSPSRKIGAEYLGAKTGKADFFLAREQNRLAVMAEHQRRMIMSLQEARSQWVTASVPNLCNAYSPENGPANYHFDPAGVQPLQPSQKSPSLPHFADVAEPFAPPTSSGLGLADGYPASGNQPPAMASPVSLAGEVNSSFRRTHVGISDIVETHQQSPGKKRTADDISGSTPEQEHWVAEAANAENANPTNAASEDGSSKDGGRVPPTKSSPIQSATEPELPDDSLKQGEESTESIAITPPVTPERPLKKPRMMVVAERLGYAALGGVTAGAMIMGTLIYTAPTFG